MATGVYVMSLKSKIHNAEKRADAAYHWYWENGTAASRRRFMRARDALVRVCKHPGARKFEACKVQLWKAQQAKRRGDRGWE